MRLGLLPLLILGLGACTPEEEAPRRDEPVLRPVSECGDGLCAGAEDCERCPFDCGSCAATCYDGVCDALEGCRDCPADCGTCAAVEGEPDPSPDPEPGVAPSPDPTPDADPGPEPDPGWPATQAAAELEMLDLVNGIRATGVTCPSGPRPAAPLLVMEPSLRTAARLHAEDMGEQGYFDHQSLDGRSPWDRMADAGYTGFPRAENIAAGNGTAGATFQQWLTSDGHCVNMMLQDASEIGIGYARVPGSPYTDYWVQAFGAR